MPLIQSMIQLTKSIDAWDSPEFNDILKEEIKHINPGLLPLQQAITTGSYAMDNNLTVMILSTIEETDNIRIKTGIFYTSVIADCSCADDPTPINENNEYCEVQFDIDKITAETRITLLT